MQPAAERPVPQWHRFERIFASATEYANSLQDVSLQATFSAPSGQQHTIDGFWDGGATWRARFAPDQPGEWTFVTRCSDTGNTGLHNQSGSFVCGTPVGETRFDQHGPVRLAADRRFLEHADGTPFLWLADTAWNGPLHASAEEWAEYLRVRVAQQFTAVQWVATHWLAAPEGDLQGRLPYQGTDRIVVNPAFFQQLDSKLDALNQAGLLGVPVLLWAACWNKPEINAANPGLVLPEQQAILLARYMVARWGAQPVVWIINGDGEYRGEQAERWRVIGRAVFGGRTHAPVSLHPGGWQWNYAEFADEEWLDILGYQSAHRVDEAHLKWLVDGPPATEWDRPPLRPIINLEPPYEDHMNMAQGGTKRIDAHDVRRALYSSMLIAPPAGVSYGGHGVWAWDDGSRAPTAHPNTGVPQPWRAALHLPAAEQIQVLAAIFGSIEWWRLRPAPAMILEQPGHTTPSCAIIAARADAGDVALIYTPTPRQLKLNLAELRPSLRAQWVSPSTGTRIDAAQAGPPEQALFETPALGDWVLLLS